LFIALPLLIHWGVGFWVALGLAVAGTLGLYALTFWLAPKIGVQL